MGTIDGGLNYQNAAINYFSFKTALCCAAHRLNPVVEKSLENNSIFLKCKSVVSWISYSTILSQTFAEIQKKNNCHTNLRTIYPTRWCYAYDLLDAIIKNKQCLEELFQKEKNQLYFLNEAEWKEIAHLDIVF